MNEAASTKKRPGFFERYLSLWVAACMGVGVVLGKSFPVVTDVLRRLELGSGSHINLPIAALIWLMIYPMMLRVDFQSVLGVRRRPRGLLITLFVNWMVKPFSMAVLAYLFFRHLFLPWIGPELADQYIAGTIILAAAPCTAMVFVWSYLTDGDPAYTLVQVSLNDLIMLILFAPIVSLLVGGASDLTVPFDVLLKSVLVFIVLPLALGSLSRRTLIRSRGAEWFNASFLPFFQPISITALLVTLVLIFAFQADNITSRFFHVLLIAIPILIQVYFNSSLVYGLMKAFRVPHNVAAPGALIGASNFFELAVATAITLFGPGSGAALATVVGVLVEVPVMLSVVAVCNRTRHWFADAAPAEPGVSATVNLLFRAFSDRTRLRILHLLVDGELCVGDLVQTLAVPQPTASRHLAYLRRAGLVVSRKEALWSFYLLAPARGSFHKTLLECLGNCFREVPELFEDRARLQKLRGAGGCCPDRKDFLAVLKS